MKTKPSVMPLELNYKLSMTKKIIMQKLTSTFFRHVIHVNPLPPGLLRQFFFVFIFLLVRLFILKFSILPNQKFRS